MLNHPSGRSSGPVQDTLFFIIAKVVWFAARPETLLTALVVLGAVLLFRRRLRWGRRCVVLAAVLLLAIGFLPVADPVLRPLEHHYPPNPEAGQPDGIIVLGGAEQDTISEHWGVPSVNDAGDRFLAGLMLAHAHPEARVIFSGGSSRLLGGRASAEIAEAIFAGTGLSPDRLLLERRSRNTAENARMTFAMVPEAGAGRWILVTSAFHMHRAVAAFCAAGWRNIVPWPVDHQTSGGDWRFGWNLSGNLFDLNIGLREWIGVLGYRMTGRLTLPEAVPGCLADPA